MRRKKRWQIVVYLDEGCPETRVYMRRVWNELVEGCWTRLESIGQMDLIDIRQQSLDAEGDKRHAFPRPQLLVSLPTPTLFSLLSCPGTTILSVNRTFLLQVVGMMNSALTMEITIFLIRAQLGSLAVLSQTILVTVISSFYYPIY